MFRGFQAGAAGFALTSWALVLAQPALADVPAIARLQYSADIGANIVGPSQFAARKDYVDDDLAGVRQRVQLTGLPDKAILHDFQIEDGDVLLTLDVGVTLGGTYFAPSDVIRYHFGTFSKEFDAATAQVPSGVHCDGVARYGRYGPLLLSFDRTFTVAGITIRPADVIAVQNGVFGNKLLDAQALALPANLNVDAVATFGTTKYLLLSFDRAGVVSGIPFADEDVMQLQLSDNTWSMRYAPHLVSDRWDAANLVGLAATNDDTLFQDDFE